ncbi:hypothetical protein NDU88_005880 [Pleurodeles waltl]|uniref:Uncharacterized protein n=1 Tax=Pleurodeles waltl TaxID=8319 RepID=A0AAV7VN09_PLEWA|nr:hypothetical protein NDU88_005880 [Pleurodeles waltl]
MYQCIRVLLTAQQPQAQQHVHMEVNSTLAMRTVVAQACLCRCPTCVRVRLRFTSAHRVALHRGTASSFQTPAAAQRPVLRSTGRSSPLLSVPAHSRLARLPS